MRREEDASKTRKIGLTIKEKTRKRQKTAQNIAFQMETTIKQRKKWQRNSKRQQPQNQQQFLNSLARPSENYF